MQTSLDKLHKRLPRVVPHQAPPLGDRGMESGFRLTMCWGPRACYWKCAGTQFHRKECDKIHHQVWSNYVASSAPRFPKQTEFRGLILFSSVAVGPRAQFTQAGDKLQRNVAAGESGLLLPARHIIW